MQQQQIHCKRRNKEKSYPYIWWNGERLNGSHIAYDTETELIMSSLHVPKASLAMAYDGDCLCLIHPTRLKEFFALHKQKHFVGHNFAFDFWVTQQIIEGRDLWNLADKGFIHDTMILDQLIQLGTGRYRGKGGNYGEDEEKKVYGTNLGVLSEEAGSVELNKGDEYRLRFGELLGCSQQNIIDHPEYFGFISYALPDVIATYDVYLDVSKKASDLMVKAGWKDKAAKYEIHPNSISNYGLLSEAIQVRGSISLAKLSREPLKINLENRKKYEVIQRDTIEETLKVIERYNPEIFRRHPKGARKHEPGSLKVKASTGLPSFNDTELKLTLNKQAELLGIDVPQSSGKKKGTSTSAKLWERYSEDNEFIKNWCLFEKTTTLLQFLVKLDSPFIYTAYDLLKRTGRTACTGHKTMKGTGVEIPSVNIQQMPRDKNVRNLFIAEEGYKYFICDYGYIELRTIAATLRARFGFSKLGEVIVKHTRQGGIDPHEKMAAVLAQLAEDAYLQLDKEDKKKKRQGAKAINFGYIGGLGLKKFIDYAAAPPYYTTFTPKQSKEAKNKWLQLYPEMNQHLQDYTLEAVCYNLGCKPSEVRRVFSKQGKWSDDLRRLRDVLFNWKEVGDKALTEETLTKLLGICNKYRPDLCQYITDSSKWKQLHDELFLYRASTLTGRVRGKVGYCDGCNSPFQGLASDGGKEAIWRLMFNGYNVKMFIHDEIVVALPNKSANKDSKRVEEIMVKEMEKVIGQGIPVACEGHIADYWVKG